jgi:hypothetical protein
MPIHRPAASSWLLSTSALSLLLLSDQLLSPMPQYFGLSSSMALGMTAAAVIILSLCALNGALTRPAGGFDSYWLDIAWVAAAVVLILLVILQTAIADSLQQIDEMRFAASLIPLFLLLAAGIALAGAFRRASDEEMDSAVHVSFWALVGVIVLRAIGLQPQSDIFEKSMFPFTETSHFSGAMIPVVLYLSVGANRRAAVFWLLGTIVMALLLQNLTLLVGALLAAVVCRRFILTVLLGVVPAIAAIPFALGYFADRLDFSGNVNNLSNLVYVQGWQMLAESLSRSSGWGIGFQQLGVHATEVAAAQLVQMQTQGISLNLQDGSFVLAKLGSDFGIAGLLAALIFVGVAIRSALALRRDPGRPAIMFAHCVIVSYLIDMFVRGAGYFTGPSLLLVAALVVVMQNTE